MPQISAAEAGRRILVFNSYHQGYEWSDDIVRGVQDTLRGDDVELLIEYLDERRGRPGWSAFMPKYLRSKYPPNLIDAIIASDDAAVQFLITHRRHLFPAVPVIFCGVNEYLGSSVYVRNSDEARLWFTGVLEQLAVKETIAAALRLHPGTTSIVTLGEADVVRYDEDLRRAHPELAVRRLRTEHLTIEQIGQEVSRLDDTTIVLLSAFSRDVTKRQFTMIESAEYVSSHSRAPVYGLNKNTLGHGIIGGALNDGYYQGREAAKIAQEVLRGVPPSQIGIREHPDAVYQFDYKQLQRWGVDTAALPAGSIIVNQPQAFYETYKNLIWTSVAFLIGQSIVIVLLLWNRTLRQRAERAVQSSEAQLRLISDNLPAAVSYVNTTGKYVRVNRTYEQWFGLPRSSIERRHMRELLSEAEWERKREDVERVLRGDQVFSESTLVLHRELRHINWSYTPDRDERGGVRGFIVLGFDITDRKLAEEALGAHAAALARSNADLQEFAYVISHDLQEPLRTIGGFTDLLARRYKGRLDSDANEFLDFMLGGVQRMNRLIQDVLRYARLERSEQQPTSVDMHRVFRSVISSLRHAIEESDAEITHSELPTIIGDEGRLSQLLQNLLANGIKYRRPDVPLKIALNAEHHGDHWVFTVTDNGRGFPAEDTTRIFGLFTRVHGREIPGTGVGLAICRKIIEQHGGRIWAHAERDRGTTFYFTLPAMMHVGASASSDQAARDSVSAGDTQRKSSG
jgi:PAS domain S-box-containing protein